MLTRVLFVLALICGAAVAALAEETKLLAFGVADHAVTEEELAKREAPPVPRFNSPGVAYALIANLKKGDVVEVALVKDGKSLMHNTETLAEDKASVLLLAGKAGVPAGGWPEGQYHAALKVTRDGKPLLEQTTAPIPFE
jgi:hypothetical protein